MCANFHEIWSFSLVCLCCRHEFVNAYVDFIFNASVAEQFEAFSHGFLRVCGGRILVSPPFLK